MTRPDERWISQEEPDPLFRPTVLSRWTFVLVPALALGAASLLAVLAAALGSALVTLFFYSFAMALTAVAYVAAFVGLQRLSRWWRRRP